MSNIISEMRTACAWSNAQLKDLRKVISRNNERYSEFVARKENEKCMQTAAKIIADAKKEVERVYMRDVKAVEDFYKLDAGAVTDDVKLLDGHFNLTADDVAQLLVKYQKNGTMTAAVAKYADEHKINHYEPQKADRLRVLADLKASADAKLDRVLADVGIDDFMIDGWPNSAFSMGGELPAEYSRVLEGLTMENMNAGDADGDGGGE